MKDPYKEFEEHDPWEAVLLYDKSGSSGGCEACDEDADSWIWDEWWVEVVEPHLWGIDVRCGLYLP